MWKRDFKGLNYLIYLSIIEAIFRYIRGDSKSEVPTLRGDRAHNKDLELHRNPCPQTSS